MKTAICQPPYPGNYPETLSVMETMTDYIRNCEPGTDLVVLPEYSNCPGMNDMGEMMDHCRIHTLDFVETLKAEASGKSVALALNILAEEDGKWYNRSLFIDKDGTELCRYDKTHLAQPEINPMGLTAGNEIKSFEFMGARIVFAVCFELYFPGFFEALSKESPDLIISPSYQRSEDSDVLLKQAMGRALDSGAWLLRSSYSMGSESTKGGSSYLVSPNGDVIFDACQKTGIFRVEFNPMEKRMRPLAHGLSRISSREIIEKFRRPELYRQAGPSLRPADTGYPRVCAHRGASGLVPENTLPAFMTALALGADEIEFDVRLTKDNRMIVCHDNTVDRVSDGSGNVSDLTFDEIRRLNAGHYMGWKNISFPTPEEIFKLLGRQIIFNIHVYETGPEGIVVDELMELISKYEMKDHVYFAAQEREMKVCLEKAPGIRRCMLECFEKDRDIVDIALLYKCQSVQHFYTVYSKEIVKKAAEHNISSNLFFEDNPDKVDERLRDGIDTILTNYPDRILPLVHRR